MIDKRKNVQTPPPAPSASAVGPCPTIIQISRTPRHWKFCPAQSHHPTTLGMMDGWFVVLGFTALWDSIIVYIGPSLRDREKEENNRREKNVQTAPIRTFASPVGLCPTIIKLSRTPRHWKFTQNTCTTRHSIWYD